MTRSVRVACALAALLAVAGCRPAASGPDVATGPRPPATPCSRVSTPSAAASRAPLETEPPWRAEKLADGSVRMTIGDIDTAPADPKAVSTTDYRAPEDPADCYDVKIVAVHGWWCATTVSPVAETGAIVVGGAAPRAHLHAAGFRTTCSGRGVRMRQAYQVQRDSWSGWRSYTDWSYTPWTSGRKQSGPPVSALCPRGRVGTYNYRVAVAVQVQGLTAESLDAASQTIRTACGTGVS
jgi:hypothetical protein